MNADIDIYGVYVPGFLGLMLLAFLANQGVKAILARTGFYALVWHRALFNLGLYVIILGAACALARSFA